MVGGRDARGNDAVVKKHLSTGDLYLHADLHGAASCALKRVDGLELGEDDDIALEGVCNFRIIQSINGAPEDVQLLHSDPDEYSGVESDPNTLAILFDYVKNDWVNEFSTLAELEQFVRGQPVFNKFACIVKEKPDGSKKYRIIMDSKLSGVTAASSKQDRSELPLQTDIINDIMALMGNCKTAEAMALLVLDAESAFWQVPLHPKERRFYCAMPRASDGSTRYLAYARTPQGSRGAPLSWSQIFGLICRCVSSVVRDPVIPDAHEFEVYVDDPILALHGTVVANQEAAALAILAWTALGVGLSFRKGQFGKRVDWIGATFSTHAGGLDATIKAERLEELSLLTDKLLSSNLVSTADLRSYIGKAQSIASLLFTWRPFVHMMYAALKEDGTSDAPPNCRWTRQVRIPLLWIRAFLQSTEPGSLVRSWTVAGLSLIHI